MKAQATMEYMVFVGIMLAVLVVASYSALAANRDMTADNEVRDARLIASLLAQEINTAVEIGPGYSHQFDLPELLRGGSNYSVNFSESRFVYVLWNSKGYSIPVIAENVTGSISKGGNMIRNIDGVIDIG